MSATPPTSTSPTVVAVLLAGGKGTRFWPASRSARPKQFLELAGGRSLLRLTWERFARILPPEQILVVASPAYAAQIGEEIPELDPGALLLEPSGHDTAPAAGLAARAARDRFQDPVLVVTPTDHYIRDEAAFAQALTRAARAAADGALVTFGVVPDRPATVYGYIEIASPVRGANGPHPVVRFREKPDLVTATSLVSGGRVFWNAGIFVWRASIFDRGLASANAPLHRELAALPTPLPVGRRSRSGELEPQPLSQEFVHAWERLPSVSVDYALMERAEGVQVVPLEAGWSDVGGWDAARELLPADADGNRAAESVLYLGAKNCSVHRQGSASKRFFALVGTDDLIVVETPDAVLICREGAGESLREVVRRLRADGREDLL